jgi:hypothetical protein
MRADRHAQRLADGDAHHQRRRAAQLHLHACKV